MMTTWNMIWIHNQPYMISKVMKLISRLTLDLLNQETDLNICTPRSLLKLLRTHRHYLHLSKTKISNMTSKKTKKIILIMEHMARSLLIHLIVFHTKLTYWSICAEILPSVIKSSLKPKTSINKLTIKLKIALKSTRLRIKS